MLVDGHRVARFAFERSVRLVTTARLREAVLASLAETDDDLAALAEIEGATSTRQIAERRGFGILRADELVHDVPHARFINASFAYANPQTINRFNRTDRGAWYSALTLETALTEVGYHLTEFLRAAGDFHATVDYAEMFASMAGEFIDLTNAPADTPCLGPDPAKAYPPGNRLAEAARKAGLNGIVYPSVRKKSGTCIVALRPNAVQSVAQGDIYRLVWAGSEMPSVSGPLAGPT